MDLKANGNTVQSAQTDDGAANYPYDDGATTILMAEGVDPVKVQFIDGHKNGDMKKADDGEFVGLRKEELAKYATDPYWVRMRIILLVVFALTWIAMLVAAIIIIIFAPRCPPRPNQEWWEKAVVYHIHPLSFQDSKNDGNGDLNGIHSRLQYLKDELKVDAVSLGPIYPSGFEDDGYDVKNHVKPCPGHYGTFDDFNSLRAALHKAGIKLILDFIPNHTSRNHTWFVASQNASSSYSDYYIWRDGAIKPDGTTGPPNDWMSVRGGAAWTWSEERGQYYYHTLSSSEPDLNLRNPSVKQQMEGALKVWLMSKVDGFRIRDAQYLIEPENLAVNPNYTAFQPESYALVEEWRKFMDNFTIHESKSKSRSISRVLIADVNGSADEIVRFYGESESKPGAHLVTNKALVMLDDTCDSNCVYNLINSWTTVAKNVTSNWQVGNVDVSRVASRYKGTAYINAVNLLMMTLGGAVVTLYGDELGMKDGPVNYTDLKVLSARPQLTPMQWNNSVNAGFTTPEARPWIPVADDYHRTSLQTQQAHGSGVNHFGVFQRLISLRSTSEALQWGSLSGVTVQSGVLIYMREAEGFNRLLVAINFGPIASTVDFADYERTQLEGGRRLPLEMTIVTSTFNFVGADRVNAYKNGTKIEPQKMIYLGPTEGVVLSWPPSADRYE